MHRGIAAPPPPPLLSTMETCVCVLSWLDRPVLITVPFLLGYSCFSAAITDKVCLHVLPQIQIGQDLGAIPTQFTNGEATSLPHYLPPYPHHPPPPPQHSFFSSSNAFTPGGVSTGCYNSLAIRITFIDC